MTVKERNFKKLGVINSSKNPDKSRGVLLGGRNVYESRTVNEITYGDEILVLLGRNLQPAASDEIKSAFLTSRKRDFIASAISSTNVDLFRFGGFS